MRICAACPNTIETPRALFCPECKEQRTREKQARYREVHREEITSRRYTIVCQGCGEEVQVKDKRSKYCSHDCASRSKIKVREPVPDWLDFLIDANGYVLVYHPGHPKASNRGYIYGHRWVAEDMIGRPLESDEVVHHRNGKRWDNRRENLEVMSKSDHAKLHGQRPEDLNI